MLGTLSGAVHIPGNTFNEKVATLDKVFLATTAVVLPRVPRKRCMHLRPWHLSILLQGIGKPLSGFLANAPLALFRNVVGPLETATGGLTRTKEDLAERLFNYYYCFVANTAAFRDPSVKFAIEVLTTTTHT